MISLTGRLVILWAAALAAGMAGCQTPGSTKSDDYLIIDLIDEFGFDQPSDSWQFSTPDAWRIGSEGPRRFLYVSPRPSAEGPYQPAAPELALHGKYRFRNFSLSCRVRTDKNISDGPADACILFGRQDNGDCLRLDLCDLTGKPDIAIVRIDGGRATRLASAAPASRSDFIRRDWHQVGILRNLDTGSIDVYLDEGDHPLLRARSSTCEWGSIALGSTTGGAAFGRFMVSGEATPIR